MRTSQKVQRSDFVGMLFVMTVEADESSLVLAILAGHKATLRASLRGVSRVEMVGSDVLVERFAS